MTRLLERGIEAVKDLPTERQDFAGELLLRLAERTQETSLTEDQIRDLQNSIAEADRGVFANDREIVEAWKTFG